MILWSNTQPILSAVVSIVKSHYWQRQHIQTHLFYLQQRAQMHYTVKFNNADQHLCHLPLRAKVLRVWEDLDQVGTQKLEKNKTKVSLFWNICLREFSKLYLWGLVKLSFLKIGWDNSCAQKKLNPKFTRGQRWSWHWPQMFDYTLEAK